MKFTCEKVLLDTVLAPVSRAAAVKSPIPCLEGILLQADTGLTVTGFNMETGIIANIGANVKEPGKCVMPARLFCDIIRKLADDIVSVSVDSKLKVSITGGSASFQFMALSAEDYPELPDIRSEKPITLPQNALRQMIDSTIFSVSENQARPIHTGCLFEINDTSITMVAVDNCRLARWTWNTPEPIGREMKFVVPALALREVEKILTDTDEIIRMYPDEKHILFEIGDAVLVCRLLDGEFLNWRGVLPKESKTVLVARVDDLVACLERVNLIVTEKIKSPVRCIFGENTVNFYTENSIGTAHDTCSIAGSGEELEIGFLCRYLLDALRAVPDEEVTLRLQNGLSPILFTSVNEKFDFTYMVLPVRLR